MTITNVRGVTASAPASQALEILVFTLGKEEYGVDIQKVQELRGYEAVTAIANAPDYFKGVVNLRGNIVPIIDMRMMLGLGQPTYDQFTVVVILNIGTTTMGMVVDSVSDVTQLASDQIKPPPDSGKSSELEFVTGLGLLEGRMLILVDIDRLMRPAGPHLQAQLAA
jgi:purine-binding chemotaxis protein CheW